jgi:hypothetical protein
MQSACINSFVQEYGSTNIFITTPATTAEGTVPWSRCADEYSEFGFLAEPGITWHHRRLFIDMIKNSHHPLAFNDLKRYSSQHTFE